MKEKIIGD